MNAFKTLLPAAVLAVGLAVSASAEATVFIGVSTDGGATITQVASGAFNAGVLNQTYGAFEINNLSGTQGFLPDLLDSNSLNSSSTGAGSLDVYVTDTNFSAVTGSNGFLSSLTSNALSPGWAVTEMTFVNADNALWGIGGVNMATHTFSTIGTAVIGSLSPVGPGPYSITEHYHIAASGAGNANSTIDVFAIPEPTTWALMIMGFGGVGAMVRSRRRQAAFA